MKITKSLTLLLLLVSVSLLRAEEHKLSSLPQEIRSAIRSIQSGEIKGASKKSRIETIDSETVRFTIEFDCPQTVSQDDWQVTITPAFVPTFHFAPHLTPTDEHIIDQHSFRTPALIAQDEKRTLTILPDVSVLAENKGPRWYMDMDAPANRFTLGMSNYKVREHVLYTRAPGAVYGKGKHRFSFIIKVSRDKNIYDNPFRPVLAHYWHNYGSAVAKRTVRPLNDYLPYAQYTYQWAFENWADAVWQAFTLNGREVGAPAFIVNTTQSPNYPGEVNEREFRSIWNQAWFSSLRSASGLYRYARRTNNDSLLKVADKTKELALSFPQKRGLFYGVVSTGMEQVEVEGKKYNRSLGWENSLTWGNSNRNPFTWDSQRSPFHILDMSMTALYMLRWYEDLEQDERLLAYARAYADALLRYQTPEGFFPAWINVATLKPYEVLTRSPESSLSVTFLTTLSRITGEDRYRKAAIKAMEVVAKEIIPCGRWEDFETYWSCCRYGSDHLVGKKVARNNLYKQCNFSMFWTAEALLTLYKETKEERYLRLGQRTLDEMLMTQASWQPPYMYVDVVGGFGVMNCDGEWNDARQSLFAPLIMEYADLLGVEEYKERSLMALNASFQMMYCPLNPKAKKQWEAAWPFFNEKDYGFMMENYGHGGVTGDGGIGIGEFTIYDWGNGSACEALMRMLK